MDYEYQAYAYDKAGALVHAGPFTMRDARELEATVRKVERAWRRWRNRYLKEHPDARSSPIGDRRNGRSYVVHPIGNPGLSVRVSV